MQRKIFDKFFKSSKRSSSSALDHSFLTTYTFQNYHLWYLGDLKLKNLLERKSPHLLGLNDCPVTWKFVYFWNFVYYWIFVYHFLQKFRLPLNFCLPLKFRLLLKSRLPQKFRLPLKFCLLKNLSITEILSNTEILSTT